MSKPARVGHLVQWNKPVQPSKASTLVYTSKCGRFTITKRKMANLSGRNGHFGVTSYVFVSPSTGRRHECETLEEAKTFADWEIDGNHDPDAVK